MSTHMDVDVTTEAMIKELHSRGYRVIKEENIKTFYAEQLIDEVMEMRCVAELDIRDEITRCLVHGLGDAIARELRGRVKAVKSHDRDLRAYKYRTALTIVTP